MASNELIDEVISPKASQQVVQLTNDLERLSLQFEATFKNAKALTDALEGAKNIPDTSRGTDDTRKSLNELEKIKVKLLQTEEKLAVASSEANKSLIEQKDALQQVNREIKEKLKFEQAEEGSINQMRSNLKQLQSQYDALGKSTRDAFGAPLLKQIQAVDTELKKLEGGSGRFQRNVGNYSNATFQLSQSLRELPAFAFSAQTGILALSNNLPMLVDSFNQVKASTGSAGSALAVFGRSIFTFTNLFTIALGLFTVFYQDIMKFVGVTKTAKEGVDELKKAFDSSIQSGYTEVAVLKMLYDKSQDVSKSLQERKKSVDELQKIYPQYFGNLKDEEILAGKAKDAYLALNDALLDTIITRAYYSQADIIGQNIVKNTMMVEELNTQLVKLQSNSTKSGEMIYSRDAQGLTEYINKIKQIPAIGEELANKLASSGESGVFGAIKKVRDELSNSITKSEGDLQRLLNMVDYMYGDKVKDKISGKSKTPKKEQEVNRIEELKNQYENERKVAQTHYEKGEYDYLIYQHNLITIDEKYSKIKIDARTQKEKDSLIDLNLALAKNTRESYLGLGKLASDSWEEAWKKYKAGSKGIINENMLIKAKEDIDKFKAYLATLPPAEIKVKLDFDWKDHLKEIHATMEAISSAIGAIGTAFEIQNNIELAALDNKTKANERYYEDEQLRIKSSGKSKQEQEKELIKLEAQRSAQNRAIEREKADLARKQAKRQKMIDIAQISLSTAAAIMGYLKDPGGYVGIALSIAAGITGAAQIAKAQATPLPEFAKGTDSSPEGYAVVGEKGTELVTDPSGKSWLTPAKDTITYLKKGSKVTTNEKLMEMVKNSAYVQLANMNTPVTSDMYSKTLVEQFETLTSKVDKLSNIMQDKAMSVQIQGNYDHYIHVRNNIR